MNYQLITFLLLGLGIGFIEAGEWRPNDHLNGLYTKLFTEDAKVEDVRSVLENADRISWSRFLQQEVDNLLLISNPDSYYCFPQKWAKLEELRKHWSNPELKAPLIVEFLDKLNTQIFLECKDKLFPLLQTRVDGLSDEDKKGLIAMDSAWIKTSEQPLLELFKDMAPPKHFGRGLEKYFAAMGKIPMNGLLSTVLGSKYSVRKQIRYLEDFCTKILRETEVASLPYIHLASPTTVSLYDDYVKEWMPRLFLCSGIHRQLFSDELVGGTFIKSAIKDIQEAKRGH